MHVAGVAIFEAGPLKASHGGIDIAGIRVHVHSKLQYIPRYRQRLEWVPYDRRPVWVGDDHFDFDYHFHHICLPGPGPAGQMKDLAGRVVSTQLERSLTLGALW